MVNANRHHPANNFPRNHRGGHNQGGARNRNKGPHPLAGPGTPRGPRGNSPFRGSHGRDLAQQGNFPDQGASRPLGLNLNLNRHGNARGRGFNPRHNGHGDSAEPFNHRDTNRVDRTDPYILAMKATFRSWNGHTLHPIGLPNATEWIVPFQGYQLSYSRTVLQLLMHVPVFHKWLQTHNYQILLQSIQGIDSYALDQDNTYFKRCPQGHSYCLICALKNLQETYLEADHYQSYKACQAIDRITTHFGLNPYENGEPNPFYLPSASGKSPGEPTVFLTWLIKVLSGYTPAGLEKDQFESLFKLSILGGYDCQFCGHSAMPEPQTYSYVTVDTTSYPHCSFERAIDDLFSLETCSACGERSGSHHAKRQIVSAPEILPIRLGHWDGYTHASLNVAIPHRINLGKHLQQNHRHPEQSLWYRLVGVIHCMGTGHEAYYVAVVRNQGRVWCLDDKSVTQVGEDMLSDGPAWEGRNFEGFRAVMALFVLE